MQQNRKRRLQIISLGGLAIALAVFFILMALKQNINLFLSPSELLATNASDKIVKLGGLVVPGSIKRDNANLTIKFQVTDNKNSVDVIYKGVVPDLFREGTSTVATGKFSSNVFYAEQILAKHDEKYMPKEVKAMLQERDISQ